MLAYQREFLSTPMSKGNTKSKGKTETGTVKGKNKAETAVV